ncbi:MAG TPA: MMPL family transporter [Thermoleophilia bacterium]|nr:MMPL family transporter [Thermoleophilia bacterium]
MRSLFSTGGLARSSARHPWLVVGVWAATVIVAVALIVTLFGSAFVATNTFVGEPDSKKGLTLLEQRLTGAQKATELVIVQSPTLTVEDPAFEQYVEDLYGRIGGLGSEVVAGAATFFQTGDKGLVSRDGHATLIPVTMAGSLNTAQDNVPKLREVVAQADGQSGFATLLTGQASVQHDFSQVAEDDLRRGESIGAPIALIVLLIVFGAVVAAMIPLGLSLVAITLAMALTAVIGSFSDLSVFAINIISMMGLAVGIDYSLFVVSRFREERRRGRDRIAAIGAAGDTATRAVFFSGMTVVFALLGVLIVPTSIFISLAVGAIAVVLMAVLAALTLLPAALSILGDRVDRLRLPFLSTAKTGGPGEEERERFWARFSQRVMRRPRLALVVAVGVLLALAAPILTMHTGATGVGSLPDDLESKQGFEALNRGFIAGALNPVQIVVDGKVDAAAVKEAVARLEAQLGERPVFGPLQVQPSPRGDLALIQTPLTVDPSGTAATAAVKDLRDSLIPAAFAGVPANVYVTGQTALDVDYVNIVNAYLPWVFALVLGLSFVLLLVAFRSVVVSATAILMNLLSVGAAYGLLVLVFQHGVGAGLLGFQTVPFIEAWVPLMLFSVLFGLSMDYQVFLLSRIRERYDATGDTQEAVAQGIGSTAGLITGAALIMVAVFGGVATGSLVMFQQIGFGLAVSILLDATLIRVVLVPSVMSLLGRANWYLPRWLDWLPKLAVEAPRTVGGPQPATASSAALPGTVAVAPESASPAAASKQGTTALPPESEDQAVA